MTDTMLRKKNEEPGGYPIELVGEVIMESLRTFARKKFTGKIKPEIDFSQGTVSDFFMGNKARVNRKR